MEGERIAGALKAGRSARPFGGTPIVPPGLGLRPAGQDHSAATQRRPHSEPRPAARSRKAPCEAAPVARAAGSGRSRGFSGWRRTVGEKFCRMAKRRARVRRGWKGGEARERRAGGMFRAARQRREVETLHPARRFGLFLLVAEHGGSHEVQETPPVSMHINPRGNISQVDRKHVFNSCFSGFAWIIALMPHEKPVFISGTVVDIKYAFRQISIY